MHGRGCDAQEKKKVNKNGCLGVKTAERSIDKHVLHDDTKQRSCRDKKRLTRLGAKS